MTPSPILKVLSTIRKHQVQSLLMGGQACVLYGAVQFSRDTDIAILAEAENLNRLRTALDELQATRIAVPPFALEHLQRGMAVHFRCQASDVRGMRIDVMSKMRGVDDFQNIWNRRTTLEIDGEQIDLLSLPDLVQAKKTQRDKDWPMIGRLVEVDFLAGGDSPNAERIEFWLRELRSPPLLIDAAQRFAQRLPHALVNRPLLQLAVAADETNLRKALRDEEEAQREADRLYWLPLKAELEQLRRAERGAK